ncbi:unnamed protein product [Rotaria sordida]|uniref:Primary ciliary dyskinesia protein 1 n=1 Tax=Rotaria sordida TaxID=392033 RepID=A0A813URV3_9BILA|nr:unnamed protein product [Rotaria sordida]CAF0897010.1 unnamed protein product [Rotaria sordida]
MSDLVIESQSPSSYGIAPPISDEAMDAKRKALEILVAKSEHDRIPVPNHLLQSKLFVKLKRNKLVEVTPHEIHFDGFEVNQIQTRELHILNRSSEVLRVDIIPPQTSVFQIDYKKPQRLVPGFSIHVKIIFKPKQWQYYHDAIRIHTPERDHHLIIPIHAYPIILLDGILPNSYQFANTPIGQVVTKTFSFQSSAPIEFQYRIEILSQDPALTIEPMEGTINQLNVTNITVTYAPTAFCTSRLSVAIIVSQFHIQPFLCTFIGKCLPGLARELAKKTLGMSGQFSTDNINLVIKKSSSTILPIPLTTTKQKLIKQQIAESTIDNEFERDGLRIPKKIDSTWAVSKVLLQKKGKVALKDLRRLNELTSDNQRGLNRQKKETIFLQDVSRIEDEEQRNKIRWQTKLGFDPLSQTERENILASRQISWDEYSIRIGHPIPDDEYIRDTVKYSEQRTIRSLDMKIRTDAKFDLHTNDLWLNRLQVLDRFAQAARKVIVKQRLSRHLKAIKTFVKSFKENKTNKDIYLFGYEYLKTLRGETLETDGHLLIIRNSSIGTLHLPRSDEDEQDNSNNIEAINSVSAPQITFKHRYVLPVMPLTVPKQYKLLNYQTIDSSYIRYDYTTYKLARSLRIGAEDELIKLDETSIDRTLISSIQTSEKPMIINPTIPSSLLKAPIYHPLTVFNPTPGVMTYETPLPYSAIDVDNAICPIPLLERPGYSLTNRYLDREDIIQGTMIWKNMSSTGLSALAQVPTMSNVWLPRWNDPFSEDILPTNLPLLLNEMPPSDRSQLLDNEMNEETKLILTPEMIRAEFLETHFETTLNAKQDAMFKRKKTAVSSLNVFPYGDKLLEPNALLSIYGRESRARREQELDYFQRKKFGQLSDKVNKRMEKYHATSRIDLSLLSDQQQQTQPQPQQQQTILIEPSQ